MNHWNRYLKYKPTNVEWLGEIPVGWDIKRLKFTVNLVNDKIETANSDFRYIGLENIESWTGRYIQNENLVEIEGLSTHFKKGDVLLGKLRPYLAKVLKTIEDGNCTGELLVFRPKLVIQNYLFYYLISRDFIITINSSTYGAKMPRANWDFVNSLPSLIPPLPEQHAIATFLDRETARIDALIEKKERQIELLQEKRSALISHAVTKGLDPNAKMKDSGVEWLGMVPEGWDIKRLKFTVNLINDKIDVANSDFPYIGLENIESWTGRYIQNENLMEIEGLSNHFKRGDVLLGKLRPYLAKVLKTSDNGNCTGELLVLRPKFVKQNFLFYYLISKDFILTINSSTYGAKMPRVNWDFISNLPSLIPPLPEQHAIADFLDCETARIDGIINKINNSVEKLIEFRSALISAAVTGKIDVRQEVEA